METGDYEGSRYEKYIGTRNGTGGNPPVVKTLQSLLTTRLLHSAGEELCCPCFHGNHFWKLEADFSGLSAHKNTGDLLEKQKRNSVGTWGKRGRPAKHTYTHGGRGLSV